MAVLCRAPHLYLGVCTGLLIASQPTNRASPIHAAGRSFSLNITGAISRAGKYSYAAPIAGFLPSCFYVRLVRGVMDIYSLRVRHISEETQKLNDIMLEIQRLRALVARAEVEVLSGRHPKKAPPARSNVRLAVNASTGRVASPA